LRLINNLWVKKLPHVLAVAVGLTVALFAWSHVSRQVTEARQAVTVPVPARDVDAYTSVGKEDLVPANVPLVSVDSYTVMKPEEVVNKITLSPLYRGKPIDRRSLAGPDSDAGNYQVVGINVDPARAAGVRPGDLVDVYWLPPERGGWTPEGGTSLVAGGVRVLKVCDEKGNPVEEPGGAVQQAVTGAVAPRRGAAIVYLAVRPEDVARVIGGSAPKSASIALARRSGEAKNVNVQHTGGDAGANKPGKENIQKTGAGSEGSPSAEKR
jgi:pilus assembly protein CpaB